MRLETIEERRRIAPRVLLCILVPTALVEAVLLLGDYGLIATPDLRFSAYNLLALQSTLLAGGPEAYPVQRYTMFVSHIFLSGGIIHFVVNMYTLWSFGSSVIHRTGAVIFAVVFATAIIVGGFAYGLGYPDGNKIGLSAGLFGLAGAIIFWNLAGYSSRVAPLLPTGWMIFLLIAITTAYYWKFGDILWFSMLGGFGSGAAAAAICARWVERD